VTHKEAEGALWLAWLDRARLERSARGHDESDTEQTFEARERVGFRRWLAKNRATLPGMAPRGSRARPVDPETN
jgi:hypothetical protein